MSESRERRKKIFIVSDHPLVPSGVGSQVKYLIDGLLSTNRYKVVCFGGAIKHPTYEPQMIDPEKYGDGNWVIFPVDGYGTKDQVRALLRREKPDAMLFVTDPRFYYWLWEIEDEVRQVCPMLYWHVWDNDPPPEFNKVLYDSNDYVGAISMKTAALLTALGVKHSEYIPHGLPAELFKPLPDEEVEKFKREHMAPYADRKFFAFWNNRNARRKQTGDVVACFAKFLDRVGHDKAALIMHTAPDDQEGQDIVAVAKKFGMEKELILSADRVPPEALNSFYNVADVTINIASNEGFGLGTLESLFSGTPILAQFTGGLQYQLGNWWDGMQPDQLVDQDKINEKFSKLHKSAHPGLEWWGVPVFPGARACTGSQQIPYIYDDKVNHDAVVRGLVKLYEMGRAKRKALGLKAREWATKRFSVEAMIAKWDVVLQAEIAKFVPGSSSLHVARL